jgi:hypothetical protein
MTDPTLNNTAFAEIVILILTAPLIIGTVWSWMRRKSRADAVKRFDRW